MRKLLCLLLLLFPSLASAEASKSLNLRVHAIGAILGEFVVEGAYAFLPMLSAGPIGYFADVNIMDSKLEGSGYGAQATVHFAGKKISDSWVLTGYWIRIGRMDVTRREFFTQTDFSASFENVNQFGLVAGYEWVWDGGFNIGLAAGIRNTTNLPDTYTLRSAGGVTMTSDSGSASGTSVKANFTVGWAF
jgi:hypothetical protein